MSLINQMLRDLDARHAPAMDRGTLPGAVRVQPKAAAPRWPAIGVALAALGAGTWALLAARNEPVPPPAAAVHRLPVPQTQYPAAQPQPAAEPPVQRAPDTPPAPPSSGGKIGAARGEVPRPGPVALAKRTEGAAGAPTALRIERNLPAAQDKIAAAAPGTQAARNEAPAAAPAAPPPPEVPASIDKRPRTPPANETAETEFRKAMAALRRGATTESMEGLHAALRADGRHISARQAMLSLLVERQQWGEAQSLLDEGLALDPAQTGWAMLLSRLQLEAGKLGEAAETLARHAVYAEQDADFLAFNALLLQRQKRPAEAAVSYRKALALKPSEARWWYGLGLALDADHKSLEARSAFLRAKEAGNLPPELAAAVDQRLR